jgi:hypothetical protein
MVAVRMMTLVDQGGRPRLQIHGRLKHRVRAVRDHGKCTWQIADDLCKQTTSEVAHGAA